MRNLQVEACRRVERIIQVQVGQITATEAARQLGLSRKSYFQWERRALEALVQSQVQLPPGRPRRAIDEKTLLRQENHALKAPVSKLIHLQKLSEIVQQWRRSKGKEKTLRMEQILQQAEVARAAIGLSRRQLCREAGLSRATYHRWRRRRARGEELRRRSGPAKTSPLALAKVRAQLERLTHRPQRTPGTGAIRKQYARAISRRAFAALVHEVRVKQSRQRRRFGGRSTGPRRKRTA